MWLSDVAFLRETVAGVEREAAMTGMTSRQVAAEFLTRLESRPEGFKFVDAGNRVWDSRAYSEMLARTTLLNTSRQEYLNTCAENGSDVVRVSVSGHWETEELSRQLGCNAVSRDTTIHEVLKEVNPHFKGDPATDLYSVNCQRAVYAYEARLRGLDIVAKPALDLDVSKDSLANRYLHVMKRQQSTVFRSTDDVAKRISTMSNGERAVVRVDFMIDGKTYGHAFIAEKISGKTMLIDPQTGKDASDYLDRAQKNGVFSFSRIDNLNFDVKLLAECCEASKP